MVNGQDIVKRYLWGWLITVVLAAGVQASTLTKVRAVESGNSAQIILSLSQSASYHVTSQLEDNLVRLHLERTAVNLPYPTIPRIGPLLQDITISEHTSAAEAGETGSSVTVEVRFSTTPVSISHEPLVKPPGMMLIVRTTPPTTKAGDNGQGLGQSRTIRRQEPPAAEASTIPSATDPTPKGKDSEPNALPRDDSLQLMRANPPSVTVSPPALATPEPAPRPAAPRVASLSIEEELKDLIGHESSAAASLALLELYFHRPTTFTMNPSLLWSIAGAYADLGLYEESQAVYRRISAEAESPALRAVAGLKRGKLALQQGEWGTAESLLQQFIAARPRGLFLAEAHEALGDTFLEQERCTAAAEAYTAALTHTPDTQKPAQLFHKLGRAQSKAGNWTQAAEAFRQAAEHARTHGSPSTGSEDTTAPFTLVANTFQQLADSLYKAQQYEGAVGAYRQVLEGAPENHSRVWALYHLGKSYEHMRQSDEALQAYQELVRQPDPFWSEMGQQALTVMRWRQP
jgi:tetratricopeptide (TPR) repeat protein